ncbi:MAG: BamA/TamA family outer membrane protein [Myxococcales bacterium]|jgi:outer membrane protein assembly factor BamA
MSEDPLERSRNTRASIALLVLCLIPIGCASIPKNQYGVDDITWDGVEEMDPVALEQCLATRELDRVTMRLGFRSGRCGEPPFDESAPSAELWAWPWTEWPVYDPAIVDVDRERIVRWYRARGYYAAEVRSVSAHHEGREVKSPRCEGGGDCELELHFEVIEGEPVRVRSVELKVEAELDQALVDDLRAQLLVREGQRFDESDYEGGKTRLLRVLRDASFARARVEGHVLIDRGRRTAEIDYTVRPGPSCTVGQVHVQGEGQLPASLVVRAADVRAGTPYSDERVEDVQRAIFALGVFSSVRMERRYDVGGDPTVVDLVAHVRPGRLQIPSAGVGMMSGTLRRTTSDEQVSVPQWDAHVRLAYEHRNLFGGMRRLRIEERPRLIFLDNFPQVSAGDPRLGNILSVVFEQPATFEARTTLFSENEWDVGPDPFYGFFRHDVATRLGLRRAFFKQRLQVHAAVQHDLFEITGSQSVPDSVSSYRLPFIEQQVRLDLRDDSRRPVLGAYFSLTAQEAVQLGGYGSWTYLRLTPDVRGYVPVFWDMALAARFALGMLMIQSADGDLDPTSARLGPQSYRLRGGGANSNRGFYPGQLGDGLEGGIRRWEGSLELRVPLGTDFGVVAFGDVGDVHQQASFRFDHLNTAAGLGLRYYTLFGALRLDAAWRVPGLQRAGGGGPSTNTGIAPSAIHLTIGEAF